MTLPDLCSTFEPAFFLKDQKLKDIVEQFKKEMKEGLEDYGKDMAMVPSFLTGVPDGSEEGCVCYQSIGREANGQNVLGFGFGRNQFVCYAREYKG
jgi:hexokinase